MRKLGRPPIQEDKRRKGRSLSVDNEVYNFLTLIQTETGDYSNYINTLVRSTKKFKQFLREKQNDYS